MDIRPIDANELVKDIEEYQKSMVFDSYADRMHFDDMIDFAVDHLEEAPTLSLNTMRDAIYEDAVAHGLWEKTEQDAEKLLEENEKDKEKGILFFRKVAAIELVLDEAEELFSEAWGESCDNMIEELADVVIQAFSTAGYLGIDIDAAIRRKMEINKGRPWKHEGEKK